MICGTAAEQWTYRPREGVKSTQTIPATQGHVGEVSTVTSSFTWTLILPHVLTHLPPSPPHTAHGQLRPVYWLRPSSWVRYGSHTPGTMYTNLSPVPQMLTQQQHVLERGEGFPEGDSGEPGRLRQILLTYSNQLEQSVQRQETLNTQLTRSAASLCLCCGIMCSPCSVEGEHGQVSRELDRLPRQADMEARLADLHQQLEDLRDEIRKVCSNCQFLQCQTCTLVHAALKGHSTLQH